MGETYVYPVGSMIAFATGEYSDFGYIGHVRVLKELRLRDLMEAFKDGYQPKDEWDRPEPRAFVGWLVTGGYVEGADVDEVHLGSYGSLELDA